MIIEDCLDKSFWWRDLSPPTPTRELLRACPAHFYRITRDIAPDFYSAMFKWLREGSNPVPSLCC